MNSAPRHPQSHTASDSATAKMPYDAVESTSTRPKVNSSLPGDLSSGLSLDHALEMIKAPAIVKPDHPNPENQIWESRYDMMDKLESLLRKGEDLERSLDVSKIKVSNLAANCGVMNEQHNPSAPKDEAKESLPIRSPFSANYLAQWVKSLAYLTNGYAGAVIVSRRRKVCQSEFYGWDSAPFRVHSDLVAKASIIALSQKSTLSSSKGSVASSSESETDTLGATQPEKLCVNLNRLSRNVGHELIVCSIELPQSKGHAVLFFDKKRFSRDEQESLQKSTEFKQLMDELDSWFLIRRFQWGRRIVETLEWFAENPKAIAAVIGTLCLLLALPVPYYPSRKCVLEPESRQFLSSPVAGRIASCQVRPGDRVVKDQLLAQLDDEQIQRDLATAEAEWERAKKRLDSSMAQRAQGEVGLAKMDILRAEKKLETLQSQLKRMEVRASSQGIVIQGDWQRSVGMPVNLGQNLFEIAELSSLTAEVHLTAEDLGQFRVGDRVAIRSDATGSTSFYGVISRIEPRATVIDDEAFFISDVVIDDPEQRLRPGMKASAQVVAGWRTIGWLLFSRPYRWLSNQWVW